MKEYDKSIDNRLATAEGQISAVRRMISEDRSCEEILTQLAAVESIINKTSKIILKYHLNHCVKDSVASGETDILDHFNTILEKYL